MSRGPKFDARTLFRRVALAGGVVALAIGGWWGWFCSTSGSELRRLQAWASQWERPPFAAETDVDAGRRAELEQLTEVLGASYGTLQDRSEREIPTIEDEALRAATEELAQFVGTIRLPNGEEGLDAWSLLEWSERHSWSWRQRVLQDVLRERLGVIGRRLYWEPERVEEGLLALLDPGAASILWGDDEIGASTFAALAARSLALDLAVLAASGGDAERAAAWLEAVAAHLVVPDASDSLGEGWSWERSVVRWVRAVRLCAGIADPRVVTGPWAEGGNAPRPDPIDRTRVGLRGRAAAIARTSLKRLHRDGLEPPRPTPTDLVSLFLSPRTVEEARKEFRALRGAQTLVTLLEVDPGSWTAEELQAQREATNYLHLPMRGLEDTQWAASLLDAMEDLTAFVQSGAPPSNGARVLQFGGIAEHNVNGTTYRVLPGPVTQTLNESQHLSRSREDGEIWILGQVVAAEER